MALPARIKVRVPVKYPSNVRGTSPITVQKTGGEIVVGLAPNTLITNEQITNALGDLIVSADTTTTTTHVVVAYDDGTNQTGPSRQPVEDFAAQMSQFLDVGDFTRATWAGTEGLSATKYRGKVGGQKGAVPPSDSGTHGQYVTGSGYTGSSVNNAGIYSWQDDTPGGWLRVADYEDNATLTQSLARSRQESTSPGGTSTAYTGTVVSQPVAGDTLLHQWTVTNTGAATLALNGGSAISVRGTNGQQLVAGDIVAGRWDLLRRRATTWQIISRNVINDFTSGRTSDATPYTYANRSPDGVEAERVWRALGTDEDATDNAPSVVGGLAVLLGAKDDGREFTVSSGSGKIDAQALQIGSETGDIAVLSGANLSLNIAPVRATQISTTGTVTNNSDVISVLSATGIQVAQYVLIKNSFFGTVKSISGTNITLSRAWTDPTESGVAVRFSPVPDAGPITLWSMYNNAITEHPTTVRGLQFAGPCIVRVKRQSLLHWIVTQFGGSAPATITTAPPARSRSMLVCCGASLEDRVDSQSGRTGWRRAWASDRLNIAKDIFPIRAAVGASSVTDRTDGLNSELVWVRRTRSAGSNTWTYSHGPALTQALRLAAAAVAEGQPAPTTAQIGIGGIESRILTGRLTTATATNGSPNITIPNDAFGAALNVNDAVFMQQTTGGPLVFVGYVDAKTPGTPISVTLSSNYTGSLTSGISIRFTPLTEQDGYDAYKYAITQINAAYPGIKFQMNVLPFGDGRDPPDAAAFAWRAVQMALVKNSGSFLPAANVFLAAPPYEILMKAGDIHYTNEGTDLKGYLDAYYDAETVEGLSNVPKGPYLDDFTKVDDFTYTVRVYQGGNGAVEVPRWPGGFAVYDKDASGFVTAEAVAPIGVQISNGGLVGGLPTILLTMTLPKAMPNAGLAYPYFQDLRFSRRFIRSMTLGFAGHEMPLQSFCSDHFVS